MPNAWMVRAGKGSYVAEDFIKEGCAAIGWRILHDLSKIKSKDEVRKLVEKSYADRKPGQIRSAASQIARFLLDIKKGDNIITYNNAVRRYHIGEVTGDYTYDPGRVEDHPHVRNVKWIGELSRDDVTVESKNSLGAIMTLFSVTDHIWKELHDLARGERPLVTKEDEEEEKEEIKLDLIGRSHEFIKDRIQRLDWDEMQDFMAGILRAMGYKTQVSAPGADRGKDIVASPDGLGLDHPRIRVEVKHRSREQIGAPQLRSFIGALRPNDKGLYVSTGGYSKEAHYEAERAQVPVTLLDLDDVAGLLVQHYESVDADTRAMVPLRRIYWPAD